MGEVEGLMADQKLWGRSDNKTHIIRHTFVKKALNSCGS
jgi:hypothetical protein